MGSNDAAAELLAICRRFDDDDVQAFLPLLLLTFAPAIDARSAPAAVVEPVGALAQRLGVTNPADAPAALRAHFAAHPPNPELVAAFERFFRDYAQAAAAPDVVAGIAKVMGEASRTTAALTTVGAGRPAGTVAAGPFARFAMGALQTQPRARS